MAQVILYNASHNIEHELVVDTGEIGLCLNGNVSNGEFHVKSLDIRAKLVAGGKTQSLNLSQNTVIKISGSLDDLGTGTGVGNNFIFIQKAAKFEISVDLPAGYVPFGMNFNSGIEPKRLILVVNPSYKEGIDTYLELKVCFEITATHSVQAGGAGGNVELLLPMCIGVSLNCFPDRGGDLNGIPTLSIKPACWNFGLWLPDIGIPQWVLPPSDVGLNFDWLFKCIAQLSSILPNINFPTIRLPDLEQFSLPNLPIKLDAKKKKVTFDLDGSTYSLQIEIAEFIIKIFGKEYISTNSKLILKIKDGKYVFTISFSWHETVITFDLIPDLLTAELTNPKLFIGYKKSDTPNVCSYFVFVLEIENLSLTSPLKKGKPLLTRMIRIENRGGETMSGYRVDVKGGNYEFGTGDFGKDTFNSETDPRPLVFAIDPNEPIAAKSKLGIDLLDYSYEKSQFSLSINEAIPGKWFDEILALFPQNESDEKDAIIDGTNRIISLVVFLNENQKFEQFRLGWKHWQKTTPDHGKWVVIKQASPSPVMKPAIKYPSDFDIIKYNPEGVNIKLPLVSLQMPAASAEEFIYDKDSYFSYLMSCKKPVVRVDLGLSERPKNSETGVQKINSEQKSGISTSEMNGATTSSIISIALAAKAGLTNISPIANTPRGITSLNFYNKVIADDIIIIEPSDIITKLNRKSINDFDCPKEPEETKNFRKVNWNDDIESPRFELLKNNNPPVEENVWGYGAQLVTSILLNMFGNSNEGNSQTISFIVGTPQLSNSGEIIFTVTVILKLGEVELKGEGLVTLNIRDFSCKFVGDDISLQYKGKWFNDNKIWRTKKLDLLGLDLRYEINLSKPSTKAEKIQKVLKLSILDGVMKVGLVDNVTAELQLSSGMDEPLVFKVTTFGISSNGIDLVAKSLSKKLKLNGLDNTFELNEANLIVKQNRVEKLKLVAQGVLPQTLIGDCAVDVTMIFESDPLTNRLLLPKVDAKFRGKSTALYSTGTRFKFDLDSVGMKFEGEQDPHFYFTISGSARFTPDEGEFSDSLLEHFDTIEMDFTDAPLTDKFHEKINFVVSLKKKVKFSLFGIFEMEVRSVGFSPRHEKFGRKPAVIIGGQAKFAVAGGDVVAAKIDFHSMFIGPPKDNESLPQIDFDGLEVNISTGEDFQVSGMVNTIDESNKKGFMGQGELVVPGFPRISTSFGFLTITRDNGEKIVAWFLAANIREMSYTMGSLPFHLREIGMGFGYRFTLASIKAADGDLTIAELIHDLRQLALTQNELDKISSWVPDIEEIGENPRFTIALRAMFSMTTASPGTANKWIPEKEKHLQNPLLFDVMASLRSDFTFYMSIRGWINTNYYHYVNDNDKKIKPKPLVSGFMLLSPRKKRLLAHMASNEATGFMGEDPKLPKALQGMLRNAHFEATLLMEPGLLHMELGWPNNIWWKTSIGPLKIECRGGILFRIENDAIVQGIAFKATGDLSLSGGVNFGFVGVRITAFAHVSFGTMIVSRLLLSDPLSSSLYAAIGFDLRLRFSIQAWLRLRISRFIKISLNASYSVDLQITIAMELGWAGQADLGLRVRAKVAFRVFGRRLPVQIDLNVLGENVTKARNQLKPYMQSITAPGEPFKLPGVDETIPETRSEQEFLSNNILTKSTEASKTKDILNASGLIEEATALTENAKVASDYQLVIVKSPYINPNNDKTWFLLFVPKGNNTTDGKDLFYPYQLDKSGSDESENELIVRLNVEDSSHAGLSYSFIEGANKWVNIDLKKNTEHSLKMEWDSSLNADMDDLEPTDQFETFTLKHMLYYCYIPTSTDDDVLESYPIGLNSYHVRNPLNALEDGNLKTVNDYRIFDDETPEINRKLDLSNEYDKKLQHNLLKDNNINGGAKDNKLVYDLNEQAMNSRAFMLKAMHDELSEYADKYDGKSEINDDQIFAKMGVCLKLTGQKLPDWLKNEAEDHEVKEHKGFELKSRDNEFKEVSLFLTKARNFSEAKLYYSNQLIVADDETVAMAWQLEWNVKNKNAEDYVEYYEIEITNDSLNKNEVIRIKPCDLFNQSSNSEKNELLISRFKFTILLNDLPGASLDRVTSDTYYFFKITPVDNYHNRGKPLHFKKRIHKEFEPLGPIEPILIFNRIINKPKPSDKSVPSNKYKEIGLSLTWRTSPMPDNGKASIADEWFLIARKQLAQEYMRYGIEGETPGRQEIERGEDILIQPGDMEYLINFERYKGVHYKDIDINRDCEKLINKIIDVKEIHQWRFFLKGKSKGGLITSIVPIRINLNFIISNKNNTNGMIEDRTGLEVGQIEFKASRWLSTYEHIPALDQRTVLVVQKDEMKAEIGQIHTALPNKLSTTISINDKKNTDTSLKFVKLSADDRMMNISWQAHTPENDYERLSGYQILEANLDTLISSDLDEHGELKYQQFWKNAKPIQSILLASDEEARLDPMDNLDIKKWKAWYPSTAQHLINKTGDFGACRSSADATLKWPSFTMNDKSTLNNQESEFWPDEIFNTIIASCPDITMRLSEIKQNIEEDENLSQAVFRRFDVPEIHPLLAILLLLLKNKPKDLVWEDDFDIEVELSSPKTLELREDEKEVENNETEKSPSVAKDVHFPNEEKKFQKLLNSFASDLDPYGWMLLQTFGLMISFRLKRKVDGELLTPTLTQKRIHSTLLYISDTLSEFKQNIKKQKNGESGQQIAANKLLDFESWEADYVRFYEHLIIETPLQTHMSRSGVADKLRNLDDAGLSFVQLSLRPIPEVECNYLTFTIDSQELEKFHQLILTFSPDTSGDNSDTQNKEDKKDQEVIEWKKICINNLEVAPEDINSEVDIEVKYNLVSFCQISSSDGGNLNIQNRRYHIRIPKQFVKSIDNNKRQEKNVLKDIKLINTTSKNNFKSLFKDAEIITTPYGGYSNIETPYGIFKELPAEIISDVKETALPKWLEYFAKIAVEDFGKIKDYWNKSQTEHKKELVKIYVRWSKHLFKNTLLLTQDCNDIVKFEPAYQRATAYIKEKTPILLAPDRNGALSYNYEYKDDLAATKCFAIVKNNRYGQFLSGVADELSLAIIRWHQEAKFAGLDQIKEDLLSYVEKLKIPKYVDKIEGNSTCVTIHRVRELAPPSLLDNGIELPFSTENGFYNLEEAAWYIILSRANEKDMDNSNSELRRKLAFFGIEFSTRKTLSPATEPKWFDYWFEQNPDLFIPNNTAQRDDFTEADLSKTPTVDDGAEAYSFPIEPFYYRGYVRMRYRAGYIVSKELETYSIAYDGEVPEPLNNVHEALVSYKKDFLKIRMAKFIEGIAEPYREGIFKEENVTNSVALLPDPEIEYQILSIKDNEIYVPIFRIYNICVKRHEDSTSLDLVFKVKSLSEDWQVVSEESTISHPDNKMNSFLKIRIEETLLENKFKYNNEQWQIYVVRGKEPRKKWGVPIQIPFKNNVIGGAS